MVHAVDADLAGAVDLVDERSGHDLDDMPGVVFDRVEVMQRARIVFGDVLRNRPAAEDVDQLHPLPDRENRLFHLDGHLGQAAIELFATARHDPNRGMLFEAHAGRVEVLRATGEDDSVDHFQHLLEVAVLGERGERDGQSSGRDDRIVVAGVEPREGDRVLAGGTEVAIETDKGFTDRRGGGLSRHRGASLLSM